ncbi:hypothetical protein FACS1894120_4790 [Clostridia bacterium]|nr:hypothetical protein FACS1894120_4790 [Clostridia bacterium]
MKHIKKFAAATAAALAVSTFGIFGLTAGAADRTASVLVPPKLPTGYSAQKLGSAGDKAYFLRADGFLYLGQLDPKNTANIPEAKQGVITTAAGEKFNIVTDDSNAVITYEGKKTFVNKFGIVGVYDNAGNTREYGTTDEYGYIFFGGQMQLEFPFVKVLVQDRSRNARREALLRGDGKLFTTKTGVSNFEYITVAQCGDGDNSYIKGVPASEDCMVVVKEAKLLSVYRQDGTPVGSLKLSDELAERTPVVQYLPNGKILLTFMVSGSANREGVYVADFNLKNAKSLFTGGFGTPAVYKDDKVLAFTLSDGTTRYFEWSKTPLAEKTYDELNKSSSAVVQTDYAIPTGNIKISVEKTSINTTATITGSTGIKLATFSTFNAKDKLLTDQTDGFYIIGSHSGMLIIDQKAGSVVVRSGSDMTGIEIISKSQNVFIVKIYEDTHGKYVNPEYYELYYNGVISRDVYDSIVQLPAPMSKNAYLEGYLLTKQRAGDHEVLVSYDGRPIIDYYRSFIPKYEDWDRGEIVYNTGSVIGSYSYVETKSNQWPREHTEFYTITNEVVLEFDSRLKYQIFNLKNSNAVLVYGTDVYYIHH